MYETVVIGSGPAGLSAALYLKRAGKNVIVIEKEYEGTGQIVQSVCVDNYLGIPSVSGETLGERNFWGGVFHIVLIAMVHFIVEKKLQ